MKGAHDMRAAIKACERAGLTYDPKHKHPRIVRADGRYITFSNTPGDVYAHRQMLRDVRKYLGVDVKL